MKNSSLSGAMAPTTSAIERAEAMKKKGNECFQKGKYHAAIDMYTEAIVLDMTQSTFYSNRALSYSKLLNWTCCRDDCRSALHIDAMNTKASYLLGVSQMHLREFQESIDSFQQALHTAQRTKKSKTFQKEITVELRRAKKEQWYHIQQQRIECHEHRKGQLNELFLTNARLSKITEQWDDLMAYVEQMALNQEREFYTREIPEYFICPVSMEIMLDPVLTPNGCSYERQCLEEHLKKNGAVDPLTRQHLTLDMIRPNASLRAAIEDYLDKNPWAFEH